MEINELEVNETTILIDGYLKTTIMSSSPMQVHVYNLTDNYFKWK